MSLFLKPQKLQSRSATGVPGAEGEEPEHKLMETSGGGDEGRQGSPGIATKQGQGLNNVRNTVERKGTKDIHI